MIEYFDIQSVQYLCYCQRVCKCCTMAAVDGVEVASQDKNHLVDTAQDQVKKCHLVIVLGASGDLARKSIYPALWQLYKNGNLPKDTFIIGSARSKLTVKDIRQNCQNYISVEDTKEEMQKFEEFWSKNYYAPGSYTSVQCHALFF